jgi:hypothetical protein
MSVAVIATYTMEDETTGGQSLIDSSGNAFSAASFGFAPSLAPPYTNSQPGDGGYSRQFGPLSSGYAATFGSDTIDGSSHNFLLEAIVKLESGLPAAQLDVVSLVDSSGDAVLKISITTAGKAMATGYVGGVQEGQAIGGTAAFPYDNWVHLAARWNHSTSALDILVSQTATPVLAPPGYACLASGCGNTVTASAALGIVVGFVLHPGTVALDGVDFVQFSEAITTIPAPMFGVVGTGMVVTPKGSAGCTVILDLKPEALVEPDGTPLGFGATDALNPSNWTVIASDGTATRVAEVLPSTDPQAVAGYWFDITFEEPLDVGEGYTLWQENLTVLGNDSSPVDVPDGTLLQSTSCFFMSLEYAVAPVPTFEQQAYGGVDIANPMGAYTLSQSGDLGNDSGVAGLVKRCIRRIITPTNGFSFLKGYGVGLLGKVKKLATTANIRKLYNDTKTQLLQEPGVSSLDLDLNQLPTGQMRVQATLHTIAGDQTLSYTTPRL